jgi:hypothetical protein
MMKIPSEKHVRTFCLGKNREGGEVCSYLLFGAGAECAKAWPSYLAVIRVRLAAGEMKARGDNCTGPPKFSSNLKLRVVKND